MDLPNDRQAIEINGSFKKKTDVDGKVTVYEARLVAKSFSQVQGVDYDEIFSSVAMLKVRRNQVSISCIYEIWQMDVKTSFLTNFRKERLYVIQSERFCRSKDAKRYASSSNPSKDWSKHLGVGMYALMR